MAAEEAFNLSTLEYQLYATQINWKPEGTHESGENTEKELEVLWRRVKTTVTLLAYLKSKARIMAVPDFTHISCDIKQMGGVGLVDINGIPISHWSKNIDTSLFESPDVDSWIGISNQQGAPNEKDEAYFSEMLKSVQMVSSVMESLVKRAIMAEADTALEKKKVILGQEEIEIKALQIENMSVRLDELEKFATGTNDLLNEMRQRVEDLVLETSRQRERAAENEEELCRVKRDFERLKSFVGSLVSDGEMLLSSEEQSIKRLCVWEVEKTRKLESEKTQKEAEVQKLMEENMKLTALLDKKEAQLLALNEQCKAMALSASNI